MWMTPSKSTGHAQFCNVMAPYMATTEPTALLRHYSPPAFAYDRYDAIPRELRAEPFVKWAGSKKRHLSAFDPLFPAHFEAYHEPFVGGGSAFLYLAQVGRIEKGILSDLNAELIHLYRVIRDDVEALIATLDQYQYETNFYYRIRSLDPSKMSPINRAARMLFLNRTCFNGLYRVNSSGKFNVPFGRYTNPIICNAANLRHVHRLLQGVELQRWTYETVLEVANSGDFVYLDPPSQVLASSARFTDYSPEAFTDNHMGRLREVFDILDQRGCLVMLSNPNVALNRQLFDGYDIREVTSPRAVRRDGRRRGRRVELVIRNFA